MALYNTIQIPGRLARRLIAGAAHAPGCSPVSKNSSEQSSEKSETTQIHRSRVPSIVSVQMLPSQERPCEWYAQQIAGLAKYGCVWGPRRRFSCFRSRASLPQAPTTAESQSLNTSTMFGKPSKAFPKMLPRQSLKRLTDICGSRHRKVSFDLMVCASPCLTVRRLSK